MVDCLDEFLGDGHMPVSLVVRLDDIPGSVTTARLANCSRRDLNKPCHRICAVSNLARLLARTDRDFFPAV